MYSFMEEFCCLIFILQDDLFVFLGHKDYSVLDKRQLKTINGEWPGGGSHTLAPLGHNDLVLPACKKRKGPLLSSRCSFGEKTLNTHTKYVLSTPHTHSFWLGGRLL